MYARCAHGHNASNHSVGRGRIEQPIESKCTVRNAGRHKLFEGPRKPEMTEAQQTLVRKRQELAKVIERLRSDKHTGRSAERYPWKGYFGERLQYRHE